MREPIAVAVEIAAAAQPGSVVLLVPPGLVAAVTLPAASSVALQITAPRASAAPDAHPRAEPERFYICYGARFLAAARQSGPRSAVASTRYAARFEGFGALAGGGLTARGLRWTPEAARAIDQGEFRYVATVLEAGPDARQLSVRCVSLTNDVASFRIPVARLPAEDGVRQRDAVAAAARAVIGAHAALGVLTRPEEALAIVLSRPRRSQPSPTGAELRVAGCIAGARA